MLMPTDESLLSHSIVCFDDQSVPTDLIDFRCSRSSIDFLDFVCPNVLTDVDLEKFCKSVGTLTIIG